MRGAAVLALAGAAPITVGAQQPTIAAPLVFNGVTVVDVEQGKLVSDQRVVIAGNRIQTVGNRSAVPVPEGAQLVEAKGKYLIPGLWDLHIHPADRTDIYYPLLVAYGVTGTRNAWSSVPLDTQVQQWRDILAGTRVGPPRQLLAGESFGQHYGFDIDSATAQGIVDSLKAHGANFLKLYPYSSAVAAAARQAGVLFGGHMVYLNPFGGFGYQESPETPIEASDGGMRIFDHTGLSKLEPCFGTSASLERCQPIAERFRQNGSWWVPTLAFERFGSDTFFQARALEFWAGGLLHGNELLVALRSRLRAASGRDADTLGSMRVVRRAGLPVMSGTDSPNTNTPMGFSLHVELAIYVAEGLTPLEALQSATLNPAKLLHGTDSLGTVAAGKLADLVLLDADPLADITNTTAIRAVVANGRYFDRAALDGLLTEVQAKAKGQP